MCCLEVNIPPFCEPSAVNMIRTVPGTLALLMAASTIGLIDADLQYKVRVTNLTYQQPFSPVVILAHNQHMYGFKVGLEANFALKILAETGDLSSLVGLAERDDIAPCLCGVAFGSDMVPPGETETLTMVVTGDNCPDGPLFTMASMLVNTNDAFVGIDSAPMSTSGASTIYPPAYDAGTEENNEQCTHIPGPACSATSGNAEAGPGEGTVHLHPGIIGTGGDLSAAEYGWSNPVAEVFVEAPTPV